jgi:hypothetical protein
VLRSKSERFVNVWTFIITFSGIWKTLSVLNQVNHSHLNRHEAGSLTRLDILESRHSTNR